MVATIVNKDADKRMYTPGEFTKTGLNKKAMVKRAGALSKELTTWIPTFRDLSDYIYPTRGFFYTPTPNKGSKIDHVKLVDSHAEDAVDIMTSGMLSGLTSPSRPWFKLGLDDPELMKFSPVKIWLDASTQILMDLFQRGGIYRMLTSMYTELATFGTSCAYLEQDFDTVLRGRNYTAGEFAIAANSQGVIDVFYRKSWMTVGQMVQKFGRENCSDAVQQDYNSNSPDLWKLIHHLVEPNNDRIPFLKDYLNMPYRTAYWEDSVSTDDTSYLRIGGYEEFPMLVPRWDTTTTADSYGKGPGWKALGDSKGLQKKVTNEYIGLDKETNPPLQKDASVDGDVNTLPGGITTSSAQLPNAGVRPTYQVSLNLEALDASIEKTKATISRKFFSNLFTMLLDADRSGRELTATEIIEKKSEAMQLLGPVLGHLEDELLDKLIERSFNIANRVGLIPPPPAEIEKKDIKILYISILAQAQRMQGIAAIDQFAAGVVADDAVKPGSSDILDFDAKNRLKADIFGIPEKILNTPEKISGIRKKKAENAEAAERRINMEIGAKAAKDGSKAAKDLSEAELGKDSALDRTLEIMQGAT